jgi:hypothetical protein
VTVLYPADSNVWWLGERPPWDCVGCGDPVHPPCIFWQTTRGELLLHGHCAEHLAVGLIKDSRECELASDPGPHWRRRAVATVRHRLQIEERQVA